MDELNDGQKGKTFLHWKHFVVQMLLMSCHNSTLVGHKALILGFKVKKLAYTEVVLE